MTSLTFAEALTMAAAQASHTLPAVLASRISGAQELVRDGHVFQTDAGEWQVGSASTASMTYRVNGTCNCPDAHYNHPPQGLCKHRLSVYLARRAQQLMAAQPEPEPEVVLPGAMEAYPANDVDWPPDEDLAPEPQPLAAPAPLPEAPASVNVRVTIGGREVQWTLRDSDEDRLAVRLEHLLARYPSPQPVQAARPEPAPDEQRWCPKHGDKMTLNTKEGRSWWSHKTPDGKWCKGR
jgi:hypothetical protein